MSGKWLIFYIFSLWSGGMCLTVTALARAGLNICSVSTGTTENWIMTLVFLFHAFSSSYFWLCHSQPKGRTLTFAFALSPFVRLCPVKWGSSEFCPMPNVSSPPAEAVRLSDPRLHQALHGPQLAAQARQDPLGQGATGAQEGRTPPPTGSLRRRMKQATFAFISTLWRYLYLNDSGKTAAMYI